MSITFLDALQQDIRPKYSFFLVEKPPSYKKNPYPPIHNTTNNNPLRVTNISSNSVGGINYVKITTEYDHQMEVGDEIYISGSGGFNGHHTVKQVLNTTVSVLETIYSGSDENPSSCTWKFYWYKWSEDLQNTSSDLGGSLEKTRRIDISKYVLECRDVSFDSEGIVPHTYMHSSVDIRLLKNLNKNKQKEESFDISRSENIFTEMKYKSSGYGAKIYCNIEFEYSDGTSKSIEPFFIGFVIDAKMGVDYINLTLDNGTYEIKEKEIREFGTYIQDVIPVNNRSSKGDGVTFKTNIFPISKGFFEAWLFKRADRQTELKDLEPDRFSIEPKYSGFDVSATYWKEEKKPYENINEGDVKIADFVRRSNVYDLSNVRDRMFKVKSNPSDGDYFGEYNRITDYEEHKVGG